MPPPWPCGRGPSTGYSNDRQPAYSPNGEFVIFSSNRSGDLDLWVQSTRDGRIWQLTQDAELDWDPAFTPDGKRVLWSSDRGTGHLEIWMAEFDLTRLDRSALRGTRRVSADGRDAENPTMTKDLKWVVYSSANTTKPGIWKVRPDGREATQLVQGPRYYIPGRPGGCLQTTLLPRDGHGRHRQYVVRSLPGALTESLVMSPDGRFITVSDGYYVRRLALAEHVPGVIARKRVQ